MPIISAVRRYVAGTATAVAPVAALPTTAAQFALWNGEPTGGKTYTITAGTGFNTINTLRQETRKILDSEKKSRGFSDEAKAQMEKIVEGTWASNAARYASKYAPSYVLDAVIVTNRMPTPPPRLVDPRGQGAV